MNIVNGTGELKRIASTRLPTKWGLFKATGCVQGGSNGSAALVLTLGDPEAVAAPSQTTVGE